MLTSATGLWATDFGCHLSEIGPPFGLYSQVLTFRGQKTLVSQKHQSITDRSVFWQGIISVPILLEMHRSVSRASDDTTTSTPQLFGVLLFCQIWGAKYEVIFSAPNTGIVRLDSLLGTTRQKSGIFRCTCMTFIRLSEQLSEHNAAYESASKLGNFNYCNIKHNECQVLTATVCN